MFFVVNKPHEKTSEVLNLSICFFFDFQLQVGELSTVKRGTKIHKDVRDYGIITQLESCKESEPNVMILLYVPLHSSQYVSIIHLKLSLTLCFIILFRSKITEIITIFNMDF